MISDYPWLRAATFRVTSGEDWRALLATRANTLVTGSYAALEAFLAAARPQLREPIRRSRSSETLILDDVATLIVADIDALDDTKQQALWEWLTDPAHRQTQIVSLSTVPLLAPGPDNSLRPELFYRLNTIRLDVQLA